MATCQQAPQSVAVAVVARTREQLHEHDVCGRYLVALKKIAEPNVCVASSRP
jgi:hypothetical protein